PTPNPIPTDPTDPTDPTGPTDPTDPTDRQPWLGVAPEGACLLGRALRSSASRHGAFLRRI
ncbi:MAG: hypothetical protein QM518_05695, partial [Verrucomicrobiota bacterium]|nr:hypothetical protein [Verrucomicrobiota bacterium]